VRSVLVESSHKSNGDRVDLQYITESEAFCEDLNEHIWAGLVSINKAQFLLVHDSINGALDTLNRVETNILNTRYPRLIAQYHAARSEVLFSLGDLEKAAQHAQSALASSTEAQFNKPAVQAYALLYQIEKQRGNFSQALRFNELYIESDKAFTDQEKANQLAFQRAQFESELNEQALLLVSTENELLAAEAITAKREAQNSVLIALFLTAVLAILFVGLYRTNKVKQKFKRLSETDGLTALKNRRQFYLEANNVMNSRSARDKKASFIIFDLDLFKQINDQYGHAVGDWTLVKVAETVKKACRKQDILGRLGGEEFGLFLSDCDQEHAKALVEYLREIIAEIDTTPSGHEFQITASFGVAQATIGPDQDLDSLFSQSDTALYQSKSEGRNRVYFYSDIGLTV
jgi:diguanylate cyclase (GGDEF)-like protein